MQDYDPIYIKDFWTFFYSIDRSNSLSHTRINNNSRSVCGFWLSSQVHAHLLLQSIVWLTAEESRCERGYSGEKKKKKIGTKGLESDFCLSASAPLLLVSLPVWAKAGLNTTHTERTTEEMKQTFGCILLESVNTMRIIHKCINRERMWSIYLLNKWSYVILQS